MEYIIITHFHGIGYHKLRMQQSKKLRTVPKCSVLLGIRKLIGKSDDTWRETTAEHT